MVRDNHKRQQDKRQQDKRQQGKRQQDLEVLKTIWQIRC